MTRHEALYLSAFLEELSHRLGNDGCNDMFLPDTPENRLLVTAAEESAAQDDSGFLVDEIRLDKKGRISTGNWLILNYLQKRFMAESQITRKDLPKEL